MMMILLEAPFYTPLCLMADKTSRFHNDRKTNKERYHSQRQLLTWGKEMPLFGGKFRHSKSPVRKKLSFHADCPRRDLKSEAVTLKLTGTEYKFESGQWQQAFEDGVDYKKELEAQQHISQELREENNLLKLKLEILLDMLTLETAKALERKSKLSDLEEAYNRKL